MIFKIARVSDGYKAENPPCEGAIQTGIKTVAKDTLAPEWAVEIKSLSELMEVIDEVGDVIINRESIVIYDDHLS